ncbi:MAG: type II toxin-antitoxin system HicB family antitoxin [Leptospiraceae bacterium]|nr:type II toxin-antitoxin system HicB family antitoxin [Leptospiraceae bacterium]
MQYPVVIHKDKNSDYGVTIPDLPGCFSAGETIAEALENTKEAILCHIEGILMDNEEIPKYVPIEKHQKNKLYKNGLWAIVQVDLSEISGKAKRVNVTIPEKLLSRLDNYAQKKGETRSGFLVTAALEYISIHSDAN